MELKLWQKYAVTASVYYGNIAFGIVASVIPPALIDIKNALDTNTQTLSTILSVGRFLALGCALFFGIVYNYVNRHVTVIFLMLTMGVITAVISFARNLATFTCLFVFQNICMGGYLTAQIVWVIEIWKDAAGPYIQAQHFFFALGLIFPPLIFGPYLNSNSTTETTTLSTVFLETTPSFEEEEENPLEMLRAPFIICGAIIGFGSIILFGVYLILRRAEKMQKSLGSHKDAAESTTEGGESARDAKRELETVDKRELLSNSLGESQELMEDDAEKVRRKRLTKKITLIVISSLLIGGVEAMEGITLAFLPVYGHYSDLHMTEAEGARLLSAYTIAYTVARALGIVMILFIPVQFMLAGNLVVVLAANVTLLLSQQNELGMYIGAVLLGVGFSSSVPGVFGYTQLYLEVTNVTGSVLAVAGAVFSGVFPIILGSFIEDTPILLMYLNLGCVVLCTVCLVAIIVMVRGIKNKL